MSADPRVETRTGTLQGVAGHGVVSFLGIPYGQAPVGPLRFMSPLPFGPWEGVRSAASLGSQAIQDNPDFPAWTDTSPQSEDCLFLNVWAPADAAEPLPVMVWLHGGAFTYGSAGAPVYDGSRLADQGEVVVISINHRLNVFGYAWFGDIVPELADHANPGQRDIELALTWVRDNAAAFGGDPTNVTVFGESGGGGKVSTLCAAPSARGLFDKLIIQSGAPLNLPDRQQASEISACLVGSLDLSDVTLAALQDVPVDRLQSAVAAVEAERGLLAFQPVIDGHHVTAQLWSDAVRGRVDAVPLMIGTTADETITFDPELGVGEPDTEQLVEQLRSSWMTPTLESDQWSRIVDEYRLLVPGGDTQRLAVALTTDLSFWATARHVGERRAGSSAGTFTYEFGWTTPCLGGRWAPHSGELPFVFGNLRHASAWDGTDDDALRAEADPGGDRFRLSAEMIDAWSSFARNGDPSTATLTWDRWSATTAATMVFDDGPARMVNHWKHAQWEIVRDLPTPW